MHFEIIIIIFIYDFIGWFLSYRSSMCFFFPEWFLSYLCSASVNLPLFVENLCGGFVGLPADVLGMQSERIWSNKDIYAASIAIHTDFFFYRSYGGAHYRSHKNNSSHSSNLIIFRLPTRKYSETLTYMIIKRILDF